jgi:hypothetical protein
MWRIRRVVLFWVWWTGVYLEEACRHIWVWHTWMYLRVIPVTVLHYTYVHALLYMCAYTCSYMCAYTCSYMCAYTCSYMCACCVFLPFFFLIVFILFLFEPLISCIQVYLNTDTWLARLTYILHMYVHTYHMCMYIHTNPRLRYFVCVLLSSKSVLIIIISAIFLDSIFEVQRFSSLVHICIHTCIKQS